MFFFVLNTLYGITQYFQHVHEFCYYCSRFEYYFWCPRCDFADFRYITFSRPHIHPLLADRPEIRLSGSASSCISFLYECLENLTWAYFSIFSFVNNLSKKYVMGTLFFSYVKNIYQTYVICVFPGEFLENPTWVIFHMSKKISTKYNPKST